MFDIYISFNLFHLSECKEVFNVADDLTFYAHNRELRSLIDILKTDSLLAIEQFQKYLHEPIFLGINMKLFGQRMDKQESGKVRNKNCLV